MLLPTTPPFELETSMMNHRALQLIAVELLNDGRNFDIYVNCPLHPDYAKNDYKGIEVDCEPDDLVQPGERPTVLVRDVGLAEEHMLTATLLIYTVSQLHGCVEKALSMKDPLFRSSGRMRKSK